MAGRRPSAVVRGIDAVTGFLEHRGVPYDVVEHNPAYSAVAEARAAAADPEATAKTIALHDRDGYRLAVVPASERLDVRRAREVLGASHHLRLASEGELERDFPACEVGALPPFGTPRLPEVGDVRLPPPRADRLHRRRAPPLGPDRDARPVARHGAASRG